MNKDRWLALMSALNFSPSLDCYQALLSAYTEKHRFYHTNKHIEAMLRHFDATKDLTGHPAELELAIWFHDAVYKAFSKTNEFDSAVWAKEFALSNGYDQEGAKRLFNLVMATQHNGEVQGSDQKLIVDIDLSILGAAAEVYNGFEKNVRKEYKWVPMFIYRRKRKALLQSFLNAPSIYHLPYFKDKYENAAKNNINRAIKQL